MPDLFKNTKFILLTCLVAGLILPFSFAPAELYVITYISIPVLIYTWIYSEPRHAFWYGYVFGLGFFGLGVNWLHISINLFGGVNLAGALFFTYLLVAFISLYPALTGYLARKYFHHNEYLQLFIVVPCLWILMEWCRSWFLTGFPWLNLGYSHLDTPLIALAPITGVYGMGLVVVLTSASIIALLVKPVKTSIYLCLAVLVLWLSMTSIRDLQWTTPKDTSLDVALIQGGIPQENKWKPEFRNYTRELYITLSEPYLESDLIIWPETAIPSFLHKADDFITPLTRMLDQHRAALITGIPIKNAHNQDYYNSVLVIGSPDQHYDKRHLVPFGEYIPLKKLLSPVFAFLKVPMSNFSHGRTEKPLISVNNTNIGVSICYEDAFGEEIIDALPEADILVNVSNDAWFGDSAAPHQHLQIARLRARETGRYLLRATNTGISAIIDQLGNIVSQSDQFKADSISGTVRLFNGNTPYANWGNYIVVLPIITLLIFIFLYKKSFSKT